MLTLWFASFVSLLMAVMFDQHHAAWMFTFNVPKLDSSNTSATTPFGRLLAYR